MTTSSNSAVPNMKQNLPEASMVKKLIAKIRVQKLLISREFWEYRNLYLGVAIALSSMTCLSNFIFLVIKAWNLTPQQLVDYEDSGAILGETFYYFLFPTFWGVAAVSFYHLIRSLYVDRKDSSILFWRSLPVSDLQVVLSKVTFPLLIGPAIATVFSYLAYLVHYIGMALPFMLLRFGVENLGDFYFEFSDLEMFAEPIYLAELFPMYILWSLPTVGWILFISSWSKKRVFAWAVGLPFLTQFLIYLGCSIFKLDINIRWILTNIVLRITGGIFPGMWVSAQDAKSLHNNIFKFDDIYEVGKGGLSDPWLWYGVVFSLILIYLAVRQRRYADVI